MRLPVISQSLIYHHSNVGFLWINMLDSMALWPSKSLSNWPCPVLVPSSLHTHKHAASFRPRIWWTCAGSWYGWGEGIIVTVLAIYICSSCRECLAILSLCIFLFEPVKLQLCKIISCVITRYLITYWIVACLVDPWWTSILLQCQITLRNQLSVATSTSVYLRRSVSFTRLLQLIMR